MTILKPASRRPSNADVDGAIPDDRIVEGEDEHPLKLKRAQAQEAQRKLATINQALQQLVRMGEDEQAKSKRRNSDTWSTATTLSASSSEDEPRTPSTAFSTLVSVDIDSTSSTLSTLQLPAPSTALQGETQGSERNYIQMTVEDAISLLSKNKEVLEKKMSDLRDELVQLARTTLAEHLQSGGIPFNLPQGVPRADSVDLDEEGKAVNEEGLPFVDPVERVDESPMDVPGKRSMEIQPLIREGSYSKAERAKWMEEVLGKLESEEGQEGEDEKLDESAREDLSQRSTEVELRKKTVAEGEGQGKAKEGHPTKPSLQRQISSADRPPPAKSVLKPTGPPPTPLPKFGSSGIRRGFLNLNPSSPGARHSSDFVEPLDVSRGQRGSNQSRSSSLEGARPEGKVQDKNSGVDRMTRSVELPGTMGVPRKTVRIQSPERRTGDLSAKMRAMSTRDKFMGPIRSSEKASGRHFEEGGMEEEAKQVLDLLGFDALRGHPQGEEMIKTLAESNKLRKEASQGQSSKHMIFGQPAGGRDEKEKDVSGTHSTRANPPKRATINDAMADVQEKRPGQQSRSSIAKSFEREESTKFPSGPQQSFGMSALERATQADAPLEKMRSAQGLPPAVPHARPSKAYAAKLEAKRRGEEVGEVIDSSHKESEKEAERHEPKRSKVRFGGEEEVKVGEAATLSKNARETQEELEDPKEGASVDEIGPLDNFGDDDEDEDLGVHITDHELDSDDIEALGFSEQGDDDYDRDDLMALAPTFSADKEAFFGNEELQKEYEAARARLGVLQSSLRDSGEANQGNPDDDQDLLGQDVEGYDHRGHKVSRFRKDRARRLLSGEGPATSRQLGSKHLKGRIRQSQETDQDEKRADEAGHELAHLLRDAKNVGGASSSSLSSSAEEKGAERGAPIMVIPSMAHVKFPKGTDLLETSDGRAPGQVDLLDDGDEENEDDRLQDLMRMRLTEREDQSAQESHSWNRDTSRTKRGEGKPPEIQRVAMEASKEEGRAEEEPRKRQSLFKARMTQKR